MFPRDFAYLHDILGFEGSDYVSRTVTPPEEKEAFDDTLRDQFVEKHHVDIDLYNTISERNEAFFDSRGLEDGGAEFDFEQSDKVFVGTTKPNLDLEGNADRISLVVTGRYLFNHDRLRALAFFEKAIESDLKMLQPVARFLGSTDDNLTQNWLRKMIDRQSELADGESRKFVERMRRAHGR